MRIRHARFDCHTRSAKNLLGEAILQSDVERQLNRIIPAYPEDMLAGCVTWYLPFSRSRVIRGEILRLRRNRIEIQFTFLCEITKLAFVSHQNCAQYRRIVCKPQMGHRIGNDIYLFQ